MGGTHHALEDYGSLLCLQNMRVVIPAFDADVEAVVGPLLAQRGQRLRVRFARDVPEVLGDSRRLSQVLVNLILNASKFGNANSPIDLTIVSKGDAVRLSVGDRGPGVSAEHTHRLFEPYYRDPASSGSGKDGVGLGLSRAAVENAAWGSGSAMVLRLSDRRRRR